MFIIFNFLFILKKSNSMIRFLKDYFYGTATEFRGFAVLVFVLLMIAVTRFFVSFSSAEASFDYSDFEIKAAAIAAISTKEQDNYYQNKEGKTSDFIANNAMTFNFNPNTATKTDFEKLGLSPRTAQSIINYRNKGGKFFKKEDFKKIYTLNDSDYQRLLPFIQLENASAFANNYEKSKDAKKTNSAKVVEYFRFNPNTATAADFEKLGLTARTAQSIVNYREKGGKFFKQEDFKKIYTLSEADYDRLIPYMDIPKENTTEKTIATTEKPQRELPQSYDYIKKSTTVKIDINTAKIEDLQQLEGIGAGYAKRIVQYRNSLGGFVDIAQLQEVYGIPPSTFEAIKNQLMLKDKSIKTVNINTATVETLTQHPYLNPKQANAIIKYRTQHGNFKSVEDLKKIYAIPNDVFEKVKGYLSI